MDEIQNILQDMNEQYDTSNQMIPNNNESLNDEDISDINQYLVNEEESQAEENVAGSGDISLLKSENNDNIGKRPSGRVNSSHKSPMQSEASSRQAYPGQKLRRYQTYANMGDDPSLMLEKDDENDQLRKLEEELLKDRPNRHQLPPKSNKVTKK